MLEKRIVPETAAFGQGYLDAGSVKTGQFVMLDGVFAATVNVVGDFAEAGDIRFTLATSGNGTVTSGYARIGVVDKLLYKKEDSDLTLDTIDSGAGIIVYSEGFFETDQYNATLSTAPTVGDLLYLDSVGKLTSTAVPAHNAVPVAVYWGKRSSYDSNYQATGYVYFQLLPRNREF